MTERDGDGLLFIVAAGPGSGDERRCRAIAAALPGLHQFDFVDKSRGTVDDIRRLARRMRAHRGKVFVEGTGIRSGIAALVASRRGDNRARYLVSSGDSVANYLANRHGALLGYVGRLYERLLYRRSWAFVGWTPYLVGRALEMGAPRAVTVEGFAPAGFSLDSRDARAELGIPSEALVVGVSGTLNWSPKQQYCYGLELVNAAQHVARRDIRFLVVGGGSGLQHLRALAAGDERFFFTDRVAFEDMPRLLATMDFAVIGQTPDVLGQTRLTTKMPEYLACGVPIAMPASPGMLDYLGGVGHPLPLCHPASTEFARALGSFIDSCDREEMRALHDDARAVAQNRFQAEPLIARLDRLLRLDAPEASGERR